MMHRSFKEHCLIVNVVNLQRELISFIYLFVIVLYVYKKNDVRSSNENATMHPFVKEHGLMLISLIYNNARRVVFFYLPIRFCSL